MANYTSETIIRAESAFKDSTKVSSTVVVRAADEMANFINGKIGSVYVLPLDSTPAILQSINTTLAVYELIKDQNLNIEIASGVNLQQMVSDALSLLDQIATRKLKLFDSSGVEYPLVSQVSVGFYPNDADTDDGTAPRKFTMDQKF